MLFRSESGLVATVREINVAMREGQPLHRALARLPGITEESCGLVAAGEHSGHLAAALTEQAKHWQALWHRDVRWGGRVVQVLLTLAVMGWVAVGVGQQMQRVMDPFQGAEGKQLQKELERTLRPLPPPTAQPPPRSGGQ